MAEEKLSSTPKSEEEIKIGQEQEIFRGIGGEVSTFQTKDVLKVVPLADRLPANMEIEPNSETFLQAATGKEVPKDWEEVDQWMQTQLQRGTDFQAKLTQGVAKISLRGVASRITYKIGDSNTQNRDLATRRVAAVKAYIINKYQEYGVSEERFESTYQHIERPPYAGANPKEFQGVKIAILLPKGKDRPKKGILPPHTPGDELRHPPIKPLPIQNPDNPTDIIKDDTFTKKVREISDGFITNIQHNGVVDQDIAHDYTHRNFKIEEKEANKQKTTYEVSSRDAKSRIEFDAAYCGCDSLSLENVQKIAVYSERAREEPLFVERKPKETFEQCATRALSLANMINRLDHLARTPKDGYGRTQRGILNNKLKIAHFETAGDAIQLDFDGIGFFGSLTGKFFDVDGVTEVSKKYGVSAKDLANHMNKVFRLTYRA